MIRWTMLFCILFLSAPAFCVSRDFCGPGLPHCGHAGHRLQCACDQGQCRCALQDRQAVPALLTLLAVLRPVVLPVLAPTARHAEAYPERSAPSQALRDAPDSPPPRSALSA